MRENEERITLTEIPMFNVPKKQKARQNARERGEGKKYVARSKFECCRSKPYGCGGVVRARVLSSISVYKLEGRNHRTINGRIH